MPKLGSGMAGPGGGTPSLGTPMPRLGTPLPRLGSSHARTGAPPGGGGGGRAPTKVPCSPVSGRIWVAHFVWENRPAHGPPHTKRPPRGRPPDPGAAEFATGGRRWSESICGSEDGRGPLPPRRGTRVDANTTGHHPSAPLLARKGAYPPGYRREPATDGGSLWPLGMTRLPLSLFVGR